MPATLARTLADRGYTVDRQVAVSDEPNALVAAVRGERPALCTGRDGLEAECVLVASSADFVKWRTMLERNGELTEGAEKMDWDTALEAVRAGTVFTTHTPVPAGIDRFPRDLISQ